MAKNISLIRAAVLQQIKELIKSNEFIRFAIVGAISFGINYGIYILLLEQFKINYNISYVSGYVISFIFNFVASSYFTFKSKPTVLRGVGFAVANLLNFALHMALLNIYVLFGVWEWLAPVLVLMVAVPTNFVVVRYILKNRTLGKM